MLAGLFVGLECSLVAEMLWVLVVQCRLDLRDRIGAFQSPEDMNLPSQPSRKAV